MKQYQYSVLAGVIMIFIIYNNRMYCNLIRKCSREYLNEILTKNDVKNYYYAVVRSPREIKNIQKMYKNINKFRLCIRILCRECFYGSYCEKTVVPECKDEIDKSSCVQAQYQLIDGEFQLKCQRTIAKSVPIVKKSFCETCRNGGECGFHEKFSLIRKCVCPNFSFGSTCEKTICDINMKLCLNGGKCNYYPDVAAGFFCKCPQGFTGYYCDQKKEKVIDVCQNGGSYNSEKGCDCSNGFYGAYCELSDCDISSINGICIFLPIMMGTKINFEKKYFCLYNKEGSTCSDEKSKSTECSSKGYQMEFKEENICHCDVGRFGAKCELTSCTNKGHSCQKDEHCIPLDVPNPVNSKFYYCLCDNQKFGKNCDKTYCELYAPCDRFDSACTDFSFFPYYKCEIKGDPAPINWCDYYDWCGDDICAEDETTGISCNCLNHLYGVKCHLHICDDTSNEYYPCPLDNTAYCKKTESTPFYECVCMFHLTGDECETKKCDILSCDDTKEVCVRGETGDAECQCKDVSTLPKCFPDSFMDYLKPSPNSYTCDTTATFKCISIPVNVMSYKDSLKAKLLAEDPYRSDVLDLMFPNENEIVIGRNENSAIARTLYAELKNGIWISNIFFLDVHNMVKLTHYYYLTDVSFIVEANGKLNKFNLETSMRSIEAPVSPEIPETKNFLFIFEEPDLYFFENEKLKKFEHTTVDYSDFYVINQNGNECGGNSIFADSMVIKTEDYKCI
ncbi:hypothetical protein SNEBB_007569, partial [Seison nebaliae]